ncbi:MAG: ABC transporter permease [Candidatus Methylumidiphilus sp.]
MINLKSTLIVIVFVVIALLAWELAGSQIGLVRILISQPSKIATYFIDNYDRLSLDFAHTIAVSIVGLLIATSCGFFLGFLGIAIPRLKKPLLLISSISQTIPLIVFVPFFLILFGPGFLGKALLASFMGLFVIVVTVLVSLDQAENDYADFLSIYDVEPMTKFWRVLIPVSLASIISSIRIASGLSVLGAIIAEFTGSTYGLGKDIFLASVRLDPELMVISVLLCCSLGIAVHFLFTVIEKRIFWWENG